MPITGLRLAVFLTGLMAALASVGAAQAPEVLVNVSYDPTRELYAEYNVSFARDWAAATGRPVRVNQRHGGSADQARSVIDRQDADVVTLALAPDVDRIAEAGLLAAGWRDRMPHHGSPYTSTVVFLVRKDNPKAIRDWNDLVRSGVEVVTPDPKTSGGARLNYLAAWAYALEATGGDERQTRSFVARLYGNVVALDGGARGATETFVGKGVGDVLITWENEALQAVKVDGGETLAVVVPSMSILAEPSVAVVDAVVDGRGTRKLAEAYLQFLYTREGQELAAKNFYRPRHPELARAYAGQFVTTRLLTVADVFGGWAAAQSRHFVDGAIYDQIRRASRSPGA